MNHTDIVLLLTILVSFYGSYSINTFLYTQTKRISNGFMFAIQNENIIAIKFTRKQKQKTSKEIHMQKYTDNADEY